LTNLQGTAGSESHVEFKHIAKDEKIFTAIKFYSSVICIAFHRP